MNPYRRNHLASMRQGLRVQRRGLTMLECLICCAIFVIVLTMGLQAITICRSIGTRATVMNALTLEAQNGLARAAAIPFDDLTSGTYAVPMRLTLPRAVGDAGAFTTPTLAGAAFVPATLDWRITPLSPILKEVTIVASWRGGKDPLAVKLTTRVVRRPEKEQGTQGTDRTGRTDRTDGMDETTVAETAKGAPLQ